MTSAETVLVSLQSHAEVENALDSAPSLFLSEFNADDEGSVGRKIFVASVAPQVRASLAATYGTTEEEAGWMVEQLLSGPDGICKGGKYGNPFGLVVDTNAMRDVALVLGAEEVLDQNTSSLPPGSNGVNEEKGGKGLAQTSRAIKRPVLSSACPGWVCFAEKTHPYILSHLSTLKSPQALTGTLLKTILSGQYNIHPSQIFHLSIMPCFDKKLEASRQELTDATWRPFNSSTAGAAENVMDISSERPPIRDVDCVITPRELLMLASSRNISFPYLPRAPVQPAIRFPDPTISSFLFHQGTPSQRPRKRARLQNPVAGTSGGYLWHTLQTARTRHPGSTIITNRGRNADVLTYSLLPSSEGSKLSTEIATPTVSSNPPDPQPIFQAARYYGFRNITNLVRKLQPQRPSRLSAHTSSYTSRTDRPVGKASRPTLPKSISARTNGTRKEQSSISTSGPSGDEKTFDYIEVMACPGGCTNGGGQIRVDDLGELQGANPPFAEYEKLSDLTAQKERQREWAARVDAKYFGYSDDDSGYSSSSPPSSPPSASADMLDGMDIDHVPPISTRKATDLIVDGINHSLVHRFLDRWAEITGLEMDSLVKTSYRAVESDVGKDKSKGGVAVRKGGGVEAVVGKEGGGW